jgi:UDP-3-O-[3-hydroxymyristoyl] N-acetylglucosamine deacetylase
LYKERRQRTIKSPVAFAGIGIHTGQEVKMRFLPAEENFGIAFRRTDLPETPLIAATVANVCDTSRSTTIGIGKIRVHTVEHVLAAIRAMEIDNLVIEVSNLEPPIGNGSSDVFIDMLEEAGSEEQLAVMRSYYLQEPLFFSDKDISIVALPSDVYQISYTLSYPGHPVLDAQFYSFLLSGEAFKREIAPCRTFSLYEEIAPLINSGLIKGGSLDNAVVVKDDAVISKDGLFFANEMVRHKILDMIGDLSLMGRHFFAHIIAIRAGHAANFSFAQKLLKAIS